MRSAGPGKNAEKMRKYAEKYAEKCGLCIWRNLKGLRKILTFPAPGKQVSVFGMAILKHELQPSSILCKSLISIRLPTQRKHFPHNFRIYFPILGFSAYFFVSAFLHHFSGIICFVSAFFANLFSGLIFPRIIFFLRPIMNTNAKMSTSYFLC